MTRALWKSKALAGKFTGIFFSNANEHDGQETTAFTALANFFRHGMLYVPLTFADPGMLDKLQDIGGSVYGSKAFENEESVGEPTRKELTIARQQGEIFAKFVKTYHGNSNLKEESSNRKEESLSLGTLQNDSGVSSRDNTLSDAERKLLLYALERGF